MKEQIKQISIILGLILMAVLGLLWIGGGFKSGTPAASINGKSNGVLTVKETNYDFGTVSMAKGKVSKDFILENNSNGNVEIGEAYTSCMCTSVELKVGDKIAGPFGMAGHGFIRSAGLTVKPGEKLIATAIFDPAAHGPAGVGPIERQITINTGAKEPVVLGFKALVTP